MIDHLIMCTENIPSQIKENDRSVANQFYKWLSKAAKANGKFGASSSEHRDSCLFLSNVEKFIFRHKIIGTTGTDLKHLEVTMSNQSSWSLLSTRRMKEKYLKKNEAHLVHLNISRQHQWKLFWITFWMVHCSESQNGIVNPR